MEFLITFPNTHSMIQSERTLRKRKVLFRTMPLPARLGDSCGFCLRLWADDIERGLDILNEEEIQINDVYKIEVVEGKRTYSKWIN